MFRVKKFLSLTALVVGGLVVASLLAVFSVVQSYELLGANLFERIMSFIMPEHDVYLYAVTAPNEYTVSFDANWWTWSMSGMNMTYDVYANLLENKFTRNWYTFDWWATGDTSEIKYWDEEWVKNLTSANNVEVVLYALRTGAGIHYTVQYWQEDLEWWDEFVGTDDMYSTWEHICILTWKIFTWFTLKTGDCEDISPSWSGVVNYFYTRNEYDLIVMDRGNEILNTKVKYEANIIPILPADLTWWTWNTFSWWQWIPEWGKMPAEKVIITSVWTYGVHSIIFDTDWWTEMAPITGKYGDVVNAPSSNPTKTWYDFVWWEPEFPITISWDDVTVKAIWKEASEGGWGGWYSGWWWSWGGWESSDEPGWEQEHGSAIDQASQRKESLEVLLAYMWARSRWIIDTSRKDSDPDGYIPRWDMAEFVVKFTENVIGREIPSEIPARCNWWDAEREWKSPETKVYAQKACVLWVMWIRMQNFMPNKILDRAEFGTILSRLLWWDKYDVVDATATKLYYTRHLNALNNERIMTQIDNPVSRKELRKWAWLMLMRVESRVLR